MAEPNYTVIYIHGILNKPPMFVLKQQWDQALFGRDMGARTRMAYWADIRYPQPLSVSTMDLLEEGVPKAYSPKEIEASEQAICHAGGYGPQAEIYARGIADRMKRSKVLSDEIPIEVTRPMGVKQLDVKVLPKPLRKWATSRLTQAFIQDTAAYFYDPGQRQEMRNRLRRLLVPGGGPYLVVAHSMGTVIAYDVLRELAKKKKIEIPFLITLGSPLGIEEVKDHLCLEDVENRRLRQDYIVPEQLSEWQNYYDDLDPVALDEKLSGDYTPTKRLKDEEVVNPHGRRIRGFNPHSITGYLSTKEVNRAIKSIVGVHFADIVEDFVIARDLAADMTGTDERYPVLIELSSALAGEELTDRSEKLVNTILELVGNTYLSMGRTGEQGEKAASKMKKKDISVLEEIAGIDRLRRYVAARLTSSEIDILASRYQGLKVNRIWRDSQKMALMFRSSQVIQAYPAQEAYQAYGEKINWAVLDTGICSEHPHFEGLIRGIFDCTQVGRGVVELNEDKDVHGHGTHVSGIIAGEGKMHFEGKEVSLRGMAPRAGLYAYRVLDSQGRGNDSFIIKALDHIAEMNELAGELIIYGVNLSLGGPFDPKVYGCGFSPICKELRRLWRQGVVVCVAAGNEGRMVFETLDGQQELNLDISIGDPANLEECIAVGSVHNLFPHLYGPSFFSSRGPTADGRLKPDVMAPGEGIYSCNSHFGIGGNERAEYIPLSGTSMACPHVSGVIASFLSVRPEFIGFPDRMKEILLAHCTDLKRDRYLQGHGIPNLVRMLAGT